MDRLHTPLKVRTERLGHSDPKITTEVYGHLVPGFLRDAIDQLKLETVRFIEEVERVSGVPVSLISTNFNWRNVIDRRSW